MKSNLRRLSSAPRIRQILRFYCSEKKTTLPDGKIAVVGSGPAAFYCMQSLFRRWPNCAVDVFEKLPVPYGLVRFGVAPDHPEVKNCINQFERTVEENGKNFRFFGNVEIGKDLSVGDLMKAYDITVLAYGAETEKNLDIPGEHGKNCFSARSFVGWYNGLPEMIDLKVDVTSSDTAVIFGHGNVALDVARILLLPLDLLAKTDVAEHALEILKNSRIKRVHLIGRRGPVQVAFTIAELREMINLSGCKPIFDKQDFSNLDSTFIESLPRPRRRLTQLMVDTANKLDKEESNNSAAVDKDLKNWTLKFLRSPEEILLNESSGSVNAVKLMKNRLCTSESVVNGKIQPVVKAEATGETEVIHCGLVFFSVGYKTINIDSKILPFNNRSHVIETNDPSLTRVNGLKGVYACGWCSKGATGVLATTQLHAKSAADRIITDVISGAAGISTDKGAFAAVESLLISKKIPWIGWKNWQAIDNVEKRCGEFVGTPRRKITDKKEFFKHASGLEQHVTQV